MLRVFVLVLASSLVLLLNGLRHSATRSCTTTRRWMLPAGALEEAAVVYGPVFQPTQFAVTAGILTTFLVVQTRINRSNALLEQLQVANDAVKKARNAMLSGDADAKASVPELEAVVARLAAEWTDTATVIRLPNYTLRFRVNRPDLIPNEAQEETPSPSPAPAPAPTVPSDGEQPRAFAGLQLTNFADMTPLQRGLLLVGAGVVVAQVWLLTLLAVDPMAGPTAAGSGNPFASYTTF